MGIFSNDGFMNSAPIDVQEAAGYDNGSYSAQIAAIESYQNQYALFEGAIMCDIQEAAMRAQGVDESEIMAFGEGVLSDMFGKIKQFFMKLWEKIKAIFRKFMARIDSVFIKSNKEFVNKYKDRVMKNNLTDFEVKSRKPKDNVQVPEVSNYFAAYLVKGNDDPEKALKDFDSEDDTCELMSKTIPGNPSISSPSEYDKEFMDAYFEDEDMYEYDPHTIMNELLTFKDDKKDLDKAMSNLNKTFSSLVKVLDKHSTEVNKAAPFKDNERKNIERIKQTNFDEKRATLDKETESQNKEQYTKYQKEVNLYQKHASIISSVCTKFTSSAIKVANFGNSQNRRIFAKMVAYNKKNEDAMVMENMAELADWEADCVGVY